VEALASGCREHIYHAAMLDPHTAAELSLDQIWSLVDDLIEAHGTWLPAAFHSTRGVGSIAATHLALRAVSARQDSSRERHWEAGVSNFQRRVGVVSKNFTL